MAINYTLNTSFTPADLTRFYATNSNIVVAKPNEGGAPNIAWVVFRPLEHNTMKWVEEYGIYASSDSIVSGVVLSQISRTDYPAVDGKLYDFAGGTFSQPSPGGGSAGSFYACNSYEKAPGTSRSGSTRTPPSTAPPLSATRSQPRPSYSRAPPR